MHYNASQDTWYQYFKEDSPHSRILFAVYGLRALLATVGIVFNISMAYITLINKSLHGVCNIMIATESFLAIFQDASFYVSFVVFLAGIRFITYQVCFPILLPLAVCGGMAQLMMVFTGVDRLLSVLCPLWYQKRNKKSYLTIAGILLAAYGLFLGTNRYIDFTMSDAVLVSCSTEQMGQGGLEMVHYVAGMTLSGVMMTMYVLIWILVFVIRPIAETVDESSRKLAKSLILIIGLNLSCVFIRSAMSIVFTNFWHISDFDKTVYMIAMSFTIIIVYSANAPVLYLISEEYRKKFDTHFKWLPKLLGARQNSVHPSNEQHMHISIITRNNHHNHRELSQPQQ